MPSDPTVSVVLPTYERADVLGRAIDSALGQDVAELEVVVVDDGSTDGTRAVVDAYDDPELRYVRQENAGANAARNRGVEAARGTYVSFLDSDDELLSGHFSAVLAALRTSPASCRGAVTGDVRVENGRTRKVRRPGGEGATITLDDARDGNPVGGFSSTTFERDVFDDVGPLDEAMPAAQDYEFFVRYLREYDLVAVDEVLVCSHVGADSISVDPERKRRANDALLERHGDVLTDRRLARGRFAEGVAAARSGDLDGARDAIGESIRRRPTAPLYYYFYLGALAGERAFERCYRLATRLRATYHRWTLETEEPVRG